MVCGEPAAVSAESEHAASQSELLPDVPSAEGATAEQAAMVVPLSVKATFPVRLVVPEGALMTASKVIGVAWLTVPEVGEVGEVERFMEIVADEMVCVRVLELPEKLPELSEYVAVMVWVPTASVDVVQVDMPVAASMACAVQPGMAEFVTLSVNATEPVSGVLPEVNPMVAVKVTG